MRKRHWRGWRISGLIFMLALMLLNGCLSPRLTGVQDLMDRHPEGLSQAVNAGPEAEAFVRELADYALQLEAQLEQGD